MYRKSFQGLAVLAAALLSACAGPKSLYSGFVIAAPEDEQTVRAGGFSEAALAQVAIVQNPDLNFGKISPKALRKIQEYGISCQKQVDAQVAGGLQTGGQGAGVYGVSGLGLGAAASAAFAAAKASEYAIYGAIGYLLPCAVYGGTSGAYAMASAKGSCTRDFWEDVAKTDPDFRGTHVVVIHSGRRWGDSRPPALDRTAVWPTQRAPAR